MKTPREVNLAALLNMSPIDRLHLIYVLTGLRDATRPTQVKHYDINLLCSIVACPETRRGWLNHPALPNEPGRIWNTGIRSYQAIMHLIDSTTASLAIVGPNDHTIVPSRAERERNLRLLNSLFI